MLFCFVTNKRWCCFVVFVYLLVLPLSRVLVRICGSFVGGLTILNFRKRFQWEVRACKYRGDRLQDQDGTYVVELI